MCSHRLLTIFRFLRDRALNEVATVAGDQLLGLHEARLVVGALDFLIAPLLHLPRPRPEDFAERQRIEAGVGIHVREDDVLAPDIRHRRHFAFRAGRVDRGRANDAQAPEHIGQGAIFEDVAMRVLDGIADAHVALHDARHRRRNDRDIGLFAAGRQTDRLTPRVEVHLDDAERAVGLRRETRVVPLRRAAERGHIRRWIVGRRQQDVGDAQLLVEQDLVLHPPHFGHFELEHVVLVRTLAIRDPRLPRELLGAVVLQCRAEILQERRRAIGTQRPVAVSALDAERLPLVPDHIVIRLVCDRDHVENLLGHHARRVVSHTEHAERLIDVYRSTVVEIDRCVTCHPWRSSSSSPPAPPTRAAPQPRLLTRLPVTHLHAAGSLSPCSTCAQLSSAHYEVTSVARPCISRTVITSPAWVAALSACPITNVFVAVVAGFRLVIATAWPEALTCKNWPMVTAPPATILESPAIRTRSDSPACTVGGVALLSTSWSPSSWFTPKMGCVVAVAWITSANPALASRITAVNCARPPPPTFALAFMGISIPLSSTATPVSLCPSRPQRLAMPSCEPFPHSFAAFAWSSRWRLALALSPGA